MTYKVRYASVPKWSIDNRPEGARGIKPLAEHWGTEEAKIQLDKRYAWMKHKSQAKYRSEEHTLTLDEWMSLWSDEDFLARGRGRNDLCLAQQSIGDGWHINNVEIVPRIEYLLRAKEYRANKNG